jgi:hypothetical protein
MPGKFGGHVVTSFQSNRSDDPTVPDGPALWGWQALTAAAPPKPPIK